MQRPQALFTNYIIAGVGASLARVRAAAYVVTDADRQQAWHLLSFALKVEEAWSVTRDLLLALAPKMELAGFREEWIPYLEKGRQCAQQLGDLQVVAECELQIGMLYRLMSRLEEAYGWTTNSIEHFALHHDPQGHARALNELAWLDQLQRHYEAATNHVEQALALLAEQDPERAMSYRVQGMIAIGRNQLQAAEVYHRKALAGFEAQKDYRKIAWGLQNVAYTLRQMSDLAAAIPLYRAAEEILKEINDVYHWAFVNLNLGATLYEAGQSESALVHYHHAQHVFGQMQNQLYSAHIYNNLGLYYLTQHQHEQSEFAFRNAIDLFGKIGEYSFMINAMDGLAMTYLAHGQFHQAISTIIQARKLLPRIIKAPNYTYLCDSLEKHWQAAQANQELPLSC